MNQSTKNIGNEFIYCRDVKDLDEMVKQEYLRNKKYLIDLNTFNMKKLTMKPYNLKYLYQKYNKICNNLYLDNLFKYCKTNNDIVSFSRDISMTYIFDWNKRNFKHEHIIFFIEESIKRMIVSEYLLLDTTFVFPENYTQTIIIIFYECRYFYYRK